MPDPSSWNEHLAQWGFGAAVEQPKPKATTNGHAAVLFSPAADGDHPDSYFLNPLRDEAAKVASTAKGRNHQTFVSARNLAELISQSRGLLTRAIITDALADAARSANRLGDHPFPDSEAATAIRQGLDAGEATPRAIAECEVGQVVVGPLPKSAVNGHPVEADKPPPSFGTIFDAEADFWKARESLEHIFTAALSRMAAPWAVLAHAAAHALTLVRPTTVLPALIGGDGSLNWFAAVAAPSGGGKGSASSAARDLIGHNIHRRNLGSGEGICQQFYKPGNRNMPADIREAIMFEAAEIDTMTALRDRSGQTTMAILRAGFSGETLGFSYRNNDHHISAHTYRMTLVLSLQPARAHTLMADSGGGTPQRFQWFPGTDSRVSIDPPYWPGKLNVPGQLEWQYPRTLKIPDEATALILGERVKAMRGEMAALDGHALFVREKFAFALAVLDGRTEMTLQDWELSGIAADVSTRTRAWVTEQLESVAEDDADKRGSQMGVAAAASDAAKATYTAKRIQAVSNWVLGKLADGPVKNRELANALDSPRRQWLPAALRRLQNEKLIARDDENHWLLVVTDD
jgi:hypothetical protein